MDDHDNGAGNELVFEDDDALNWATTHEASGVGEPRIYIRCKTKKRKEPTSGSVTLIVAQTSKNTGSGCIFKKEASVYILSTRDS